MMQHLELDFALDRALRQRRRQAVLAALGLLLGVQIGLNVWRFQSVQDAGLALQAQQLQLQRSGANQLNAPLSAEQTKAATSAQAMLESLAVPWDSLLGAIEAARTPRIVVEAIQPHAPEASVSLSVSSPDFATLAEFIKRLSQQEALYDVMLVSEALPDNGGSTVRAVISANWSRIK